MKKILYALVALFTIVGFHANAQININIGSNNEAVGEVVSIPVYVQIPLGYQNVDHCEGSFLSIDPSVAEIINISSSLGSTSMDGSSANFSFDNVPVSYFTGVFVTLDVKIYDLGCSYIGLTNNTEPFGTLEFVLDGVVFDDLATDLNISPGQVCGIQGCNCDMSNVAMGPFTITPAAGDCEIHTISMAPVDPCPNTEFSHSYYWEIYNAAGGLVHTNTGSNWTQNAFVAPGIYTIVVHFTLEDNSGCVKTVSYSEDFDFSGCGGCSCNPFDLALGPITFIQSSSDCSSYVINVPPVTGCSDVEESSTYNFKIYNPSGVLIYNQDESLDATLFDFYTFPFGEYNVVVTYTITDDSGCTHTLPPVTEVFDWGGCVTCSCDPNDLVLGPVTFIQSPTYCSSYVINVPPVAGCLDVEVSRNYNFKIYNADGFLVYEVNGTLDGTIFDFDTYPPGQFLIEVTYTMTDDTGCEHTLPKESTTLDWTGCDCQLLGPPTFVDCQPGINPNATFHTLFWSAVSGAVSFEVEIILNDPTCCPDAISPTYTILVQRTGTSWNIPSDGRCYSWRVRSVCLDGTKSDWSTRSCSCVADGDSGGFSKSLIQSEEQFLSEELHLTAVPNPATNHVDITISGLLIDADLSNTEMIIYDMSGKMVYTSDIALDETKRVDLSSLKSGLYLINVVDDGAILSTEKLIVE